MVEERLRRRIAPRVHMLVIVALSGASGLLASFLLLKSGMTSMAARYPLAAALAYGVFIALIWLWLRRYRIYNRSRSGQTGSPERQEFDVDLVELPVRAIWENIGSATPKPQAVEFGGGGGFAGGGSGRAFGHGAVQLTTDSGGSGLDLDWDLGDDALPLVLALIVALIVFGVLLYVVYIAPPLFAEILLDAAIAGGMYHRLRRRTDASWLRTVFRHTVVPAGFVVGLLFIGGLILQGFYPTATSIGRVWEQANKVD